MPTLADVLRQTGYAQDGTLVAPASESPMTKALSEHIKTLPQQLATNQAALDSAIGSWNKTDFGTGLPNPNYRPEAIAELTQLMPNIGALTAWHGTPHNILGKFDISKVGTGEGAQVYGHGMYFAEASAVADQYRKDLSAIVNYDLNTKKFQVLDRDRKILGEYDNMAKAVQEAEKAGNLYKVDIPDEYIPNMLDWDKPLSAQPQITEKLKNLGDAELNKLGINPDFTRRSTGKELTGESLYDVLTTHNSQKDASKLLANLEIPGIRYLDQGSRSTTGGELIGITKTPNGYVSKVKIENRGGAGFSMPTQQFTSSMPFKTEAEAKKWAEEKIGAGTSNFVVFDPSEVKILEKNSKPVSRKKLIEEQVNKLKD